ncbi:MAG: beta strand repeat-containing protein, partial [Opitutales bacterium]
FTLKINSTGASQSLALGAFDLGFGSNGGGILVTGTNAYTISGTGGLRVGTNSSGDLVIHQFNTGGLTISAPIKDQTASTGVTHLVKAGTGLLTLSGDNTFTGTITVNAGILAYSNNGISGAGTLGRGIATAVRLADGATLRYVGTNTSAATLAAGTTANSHSILLMGGVASVDIPATANNLNIASVFSGAGGLSKTGAGNLTLSGANTFTGPLIVTTGRLITNDNRIADTVPVTVNSGAFWELNTGGDAIGSLSGSGTIVWNDSGTQRGLNVGGDNTNTTFSGTITNIGSRGDHNFSKRGSGVFTVNMPATVALSGGNTYIDAGVIRVATGAGQQFPTNATYTINNAAQSAIFDLNGSSQRVGTLNFYNTNSTIASQGLILLGNGGTLTLGGDVNVNSFNGNPQAAGIIGGAGSTLSLGNAARIFNVRKSLSLAPDEADFVIDAAIDGGGTAGAWIKQGGGTLRVQGQSLLNGTLATRFDAGLTLLDYTTAASTLVSNRLNPAGGIDLRGGSVRLLGNPNFDVSQTVAGLTLPEIAANTTGGYSSIELFGASGRNLVLNLGPISQRVAGTVRFVLPAGAQGATNGITTTTSNDLFTGLLGTLGAAATVTDGSGSTSFATRVGTNIVPVTMASRDALAGVTNGENITDVTGYAGSLQNVVSPISIRFNAAGSSILSIPDGGVLKVISGGILQTLGAGSANLSLASGATTVGSLSVSVTSTSGLIAGMPVSGTGLPPGARITQVVDATTFLIDRPAVSTETGIAYTAGAVTVLQGGTLRSPTRELIIGNDTQGWAANVFGDPNSLYPTKRLLITSSIDGQQGLTKTGNGTLVLRAGALANDFSGLIQLQGGVLELARSGRGSFAVGDSAPIVFANRDASNLRMVMDGISLSGVAGATAIGSTVVKVDSTLGLSVGQLLSGNGINPGSRVASLNFTASYVAVPSAVLAGAATTNASTTVTVASTTGLVVGQPVTGPGIPAGAYIAAITPGASITLSVAATATAPSVSLNAAAVTEVTTAGRHGVTTGESLAISGAAAGFNGTFNAIVDPVLVDRFVLTGTPDVAAGAPQTLVIDAGRRFVMTSAAFLTATGPTVVQAAATYGETVGAISGGNRQTNSQYTFIDLGLGTTLTVNQTQDSTFAGELMGLGALRIIGNGTLTLSNLNRNHGSLIVDSGVLLLSTTNGGGSRIFQSLVAGNFPDITVNRYGSLYVNRNVSDGTSSIGDAIDIHLNSAAGTRGNLVSGSNYADTVPLGFSIWSIGGASTENINNVYLDSGTNYLSGHTSGNRRITFGVTGILRANQATALVRGRPLGATTSDTTNTVNWFIRNTGEQTNFINAMIGGAGADVALAAGATTAGSTDVTVTSTAGLVANMRVTGTGIPAGAYVVSVTNATTFVLSAPATASATGLTLNAVALNKSIVPWMVAHNVANISGPVSEDDMGNTLVTYVSGIGLRDLKLATDFSTFANALSTSDNVREALTGDLTLGAASPTVNALVLHNNTAAATNADYVVSGTGSLANASGAFLFTLNPLATAGSDNSVTLALTGGLSLAAPANEYVFSVINPGSSAISPRLTANISSNLTSSGNLTKSGRGTLVLSGANTAGGGVRTLTPSLTYWNTTVNEGVLAISDLDNIGGATGNVVLAGGTLRLLPGFADDLSQRNVTFLSAGGTIDVTTNDLVFANAIGGAAGASIGGLTKAGTGSLTLGATTTFTGATTVANGRLVLGGGSSNRLPSAAELFIGSGSGTASGVLQLGDANGASHQTVSSLSGVTGVQAADITILNPGQGFTSTPIVSFDAIGGLMGAQGAQVVANVSGGIITGLTITDPGLYRPGFAPIVTVSGGGGSAASILVRRLGSVSNNAIVGGSSAVSDLTVDQDITTIYQGAIGGVGVNQDNVGIIKSGVGTLTLSGSLLSYVGQTTVLGGRLNITGGQSAALRTSSVKVGAGAILNFNNTVGQAIALGAGVLDLGAGASGSASLGFDIGSLAGYDRISSSAPAVTANRVIVNLTGLNGLTAGSYDLLTAASGLSGATYSLGEIRTFGGHTFALSSTDTAVTLTTTALPTDLYWRIGSDVSWSSLNYANFDTNFTTDSAGLVNAKGFPGQANNVIFSATPGAATTAYVTTLDGDFTVGSLRFTSTPAGVTNVTIAQGGPETTTALTIAPASSAQGITIEDNAGSVLISAPLVLGAPQTWSIAGTGANGSTLAVTGAVSGAAGNDLLISGLAGSSLVFSGLNTYAGSTSFPGMVLTAGVANAFSPNSTHILSAQGAVPGVLRLNGFNNTIGGLSGVGFVENADPLTAVTLTVGRNNQSTVFAGEIRDGGLTALGLTKVGNGALTLSGANTYTGNTFVNGGTLNLTGSLVGAVATSYLYYGNSPYQSIVNVTGNVDLFSMQGANTVGAVSIYNQSAGTVRLFTVGNGGNHRVATIGYGYFNLTGGLYQMSTGTGINRFNLNENNAAAVGVGYVGGTGVLNNANAGNDWFILAYQGLAQLTVGQGGFINRQNSLGQIGLVLGGTGTSGTLNIAGGAFDFGGSNLRWGNGGITSSTSFFNVTAGTVSIGNNGSINMTAGRGNVGYNNFAGGTVRANAAMTTGILPSLLNAGGSYVTADNRIATPYALWTNTLYGAIDNSAVAGAASANGALTIDTNGFAVSLAGLTAASGAGLTQADLAVTGGSGYVGAPAVTFSTAGLMPGGSPAAGYAVIDNGQVTGIVITSPGTYQPGTVPTVTLTGGGGTGASVVVSALNTANTAGRLIKAGQGTLTFTGVNTFSTAMSINAGSVAVGAGGALNATTLDGYQAGRFLVVAQGGAIVANAADSLGKLDRFTNASSTGAVALTSATASSAVDLSKSGLNLTGMALGAGMGDVTYSGAFTPGLAGLYRLGGGGSVLNFASNITGGYETRVDIVGTAVAFSGTNTFKGGLVLNAGGTLQVLSGSASAGYGASAGGLIATGGTIRWATGSTTDITSGAGAIPGGISLIGTVLADTNGNNVELAGSIGNRAATGGSREGLSGGLTKVGNGVLALSAANTFTGNTTVIDGSILLKHSDALA